MDKKYIECGELLKIPPLTRCGGPLTEYAEGYLDCVEDTKEAINSIPAADVAEVRHGEWLPSPDGFHPTLCNKCGEPALFEYVRECFGVEGFHRCQSNYCPFCGAEMSGGKGND